MREIFFKGVAVENVPEAGVRIYDVVYGIPFVRKGKMYMYIEELGAEVRVCDKGVCQYTGLSDATRKLVYEHDILEDVKGDKFEVVYDEDRAAFVLKDMDTGETYDKLGSSPAMYVVIGNKVLDEECSNRERFVNRLEEFIADESAETMEIDKEDAEVILDFVNIAQNLLEPVREAVPDVQKGKLVPGSVIVRFAVDSGNCCGISSIYIAALVSLYGSGPGGECRLDIKMKILRVSAGGAFVPDINVEDKDGCFDDDTLKKLSKAITYQEQKISDAIYEKPYEEARGIVADIVENTIEEIFSKKTEARQRG